jgi:metal-dependent amidase/aminoacylase/carboxypeptidase family protein
MSTIAVHQVVANYSGRAAHAAAAPDEGINALDAAVLGYVNLAALRQHIGDDERVHGVFTMGGDKPNIVPDTAQTHWYVRSPRLTSLELLKPRVEAALSGGAMATGASVTLEWLDEPYAEMLDNRPLLDRFASYMAAQGRPLAEPTAATKVVGSTDMGNVSFVVPSIHPMVAAAPPGTPIDTTEFARGARGPQGDAAVMVGALAMAKCAADLWADERFVAEVRRSFEASLEGAGVRG